MSHDPIDDLRSRLRDLGYLDRGVGKLFSVNAAAGRGSAAEMLAVASKAALLLTAPLALLPVVITLLRNGPLPPGALAQLVVLYLAGSFLFTLLILLLATSIVRVAPTVLLRRQGALMAASLACAVAVTATPLTWWLGLRSQAQLGETLIAVTGLAGIFILGRAVSAAAILSFSVHETGALPLVRSRTRRTAVIVCSAFVAAAALALAWRPQPAVPAPGQIAVSDRGGRLLFLAVDGISRDLFLSQAALRTELPHIAPIRTIEADSPAETWTTIGTGTPTELHGVRDLDGARIGGAILRSTSRFDPALSIASGLELVQRIALPPAARERSHVWEILSGRALPSLAVNWWATGTQEHASLRSVGSDRIFRNAGRNPLTAAGTIDAAVAKELAKVLEDPSTRFATGYFPGLDILLNRIDASASSRTALGIRSSTLIAELATAARQSGWDVIILGVDAASGQAFLASSTPLRAENLTVLDVAPTILHRFGFPASAEMPGVSASPGPSQPRIASYGTRRTDGSPSPAPDAEYFRQLEALGYIGN